MDTQGASEGACSLPLGARPRVPLWRAWSSGGCGRAASGLGSQKVTYRTHFACQGYYCFVRRCRRAAFPLPLGFPSPSPCPPFAAGSLFPRGRSAAGALFPRRVRGAWGGGRRTHFACLGYYCFVRRLPAASVWKRFYLHIRKKMYICSVIPHGIEHLSVL